MLRGVWGTQHPGAQWDQTGTEISKQTFRDTNHILTWSQPVLMDPGAAGITPLAATPSSSLASPCCALGITLELFSQSTLSV